MYIHTYQYALICIVRFHFYLSVSELVCSFTPECLLSFLVVGLCTYFNMHYSFYLHSPGWHYVAWKSSSAVWGISAPPKLCKFWLKWVITQNLSSLLFYTPPPPQCVPVCAWVGVCVVGMQNSESIRCWCFLWRARSEVKGRVCEGSEADSMETAGLLPCTNNLPLTVMAVIFYGSG